ncbi:MAG: prolyl oligopeptidase family serine peptidase [Bacteroidales bacterium]|nr:prolyl oligopeptidase family serine peptidase [Bacteroidales bacterium]
MKRCFLFFILVCFSISAASQTRKPLTIDDLTRWNRITERVISDNGSLAGFVYEPWVGDPVIKLFDSKGAEKVSFDCASGVAVTAGSRFMIFTIRPPSETVKELKLKKTRQEDMPLNSLGIHDISKGTTDTIKRLKSHKVPSKWAGWAAWQCEPPAGRTAVTETASVKDKGAGNESDQKKQKSESADNGYHLQIRNLISGVTDTVKFVTDYLFAEEDPFLLCATTGDGENSEPEVILVDLRKNIKNVIYSGKGKYKQLSVSKQGDRAAFLVSIDEKDKAGNSWSLCYHNGGGTASVVAGPGSTGIPSGWIVNENTRPSFGEKSGRLFFGTSPAYKLKDTTILGEERPNVDVWHYAEGRLHTVQTVNRARDLRRTYTAVYHGNNGTIVQLGNESMPDIQLIEDGDAETAVGLSNLPYELESMWESSPLRYDIWLVNVLTGAAKKIKENYRARPRVSPAGKYLYWYHAIDSSWYAYDISGGTEARLTSRSSLPCHDELHDVPGYPDAYPAGGWLKDDAALLIHDRYDLWSLDPDNRRAPVNITINGRKNRLSYRLIDLDYENDYIDPEAKHFLSSFNEATKGNAFYSIDLRKKNPLRLTDANPQQKEYLWGSAEPVKWISLDGREVEGLLYKPEGFDPSRKYPMIVNFYEKSSSELYSHGIPEAHRSTIDYHYYTSNGYLVFNPDVHYITGYPGQSAYNCVMPGVLSLISKGFVDEKHVGAQGHSWGGYQVAYLAVRTDLFAAIESGAPVVNMYSAYGGIRWETGLNRSMQYEYQQSRIGGRRESRPLKKSSHWGIERY